MGRSRLAYRAKHKGILSDNSRKQISAAHKARQQESEIVPEAVISEDTETSESDEEEYLEGINILDEPKLYIRENEYSDYISEAKLDLDDKEPFCVSSFVAG